MAGSALVCKARPVSPFHALWDVGHGSAPDSTRIMGGCLSDPQRHFASASRGLCLMHKAFAEISQFPLPGAPDAARARLRWLPRPRWSPRSPRLGIGWRLGLGLAAVTAVLLLGESLATRTARQALEAVRSMQTEHEPLANRANAVLEKLIAYDRAVGEYVQAHSADDKLSTITLAGDALEAAVAEYFSSAPPRAVTAAATGLRQQLTRHIANARQLATRASQRLQWDARRQAALDDVYRRIVSAGGSGLAINGTQVVAERSRSACSGSCSCPRARDCCWPRSTRPPRPREPSIRSGTPRSRCSL